MLNGAAVWPSSAQVPADETVQPAKPAAWSLVRNKTSATGERQILAVQTTRIWGEDMDYLRCAGLHGDVLSLVGAVCEPPYNRRQPQKIIEVPLIFVNPDRVATVHNYCRGDDTGRSPPVRLH